MAAKKTKTKTVNPLTVAQPRKQFFLYGKPESGYTTITDDLRDLIDEYGANDGDVVTVLEVVNVKTLNIGSPVLV